MQVQAIQERQLYSAAWRSSAPKNGDCHLCRGERPFKGERIQTSVMEVIAFKFNQLNFSIDVVEYELIKKDPLTRNVIHTSHCHRTFEASPPVLEFCSNLHQLGHKASLCLVYQSILQLQCSIKQCDSKYTICGNASSYNSTILW